MTNSEMTTIRTFFLRDLDKFIAEIQSFPSGKSLWLTSSDVKNPAGNLALHIAGNLQHFIGATLGGTGYLRDREREFSEKNVSQTALLEGLFAAKKVVEEVLGKMNDAQLADRYPADYFGKERSNLFVLLTLLTHLNYHLGQVNYLRRSINDFNDE